MKRLFFAAALLSTITAAAQQNNPVDQQVLNKQLSAASGDFYKQQGIVVQTVNDTVRYSLPAGTTLSHTLPNGDNVKYGNGQMPVILPNPDGIHYSMPNAGLQKTDPLLLQGQIPNAAPRSEVKRKPVIIPWKE